MDSMDESDVPQDRSSRTTSTEVTEPIEHEWPEGTTYHINSRRLKTRQLKRIAAALGVPAESASAKNTRTICNTLASEQGDNSYNNQRAPNK